MKDYIKRHKYDVIGWLLIVAFSVFFAATYTTYRRNLDNVLFWNADAREAVFVDGRLPKTVSVGKVDPLNPFVYEPPYIETRGNTMPQIMRFYPLTEEQRTTVNWYELWGGIREHFIAPALYVAAKLLTKIISH